MFQSRWDEAAAAFGKVVELYPGSFAGQRDLGGAYEQLNRVDDAARASTRRPSRCATRTICACGWPSC